MAFQPRLVWIFLFVLLGVFRSFAQAAESPVFGCEEGAVETGLDRHPALKFEPVAEIPATALGEQSRKFDFNNGGQTGTVDFFLSASLPETHVGRASTATLTLYAKASLGETNPATTHTWQLVSTSAAGQNKTSNTFTFDATKIAGCFGNEDLPCKFANIGWATRDGTPIFNLSFTEDQGGANASNWTTANILLDFRTLPPHALASTDCGYNEGGGVCTAIDSGEAERVSLGCEWTPKNNDFLCSEELPNVGHRDFFLLTSARPPLRPGEVTSLTEALTELRASAGAKVAVAGIGRVMLVDSVKLDARRSVSILAAGSGGIASFYFVPETNSVAEQAVLIPVHDFNQARSTSATGEEKRAWTIDSDLPIHSHRIYDDAHLSVLQAVTGSAPFMRTMYWIGIGKGKRPAFDVIRVAGGPGEYMGCGRNQNPASVCRVEGITPAFHASLRIQPPYAELENGEKLAWTLEDDGKTLDCLRDGEIHWAGESFSGSIHAAKCASAAAPKFLKIADDGSITLSDSADVTP